MNIQIQIFQMERSQLTTVDQSEDEYKTVFYCENELTELMVDLMAREEIAEYHNSVNELQKEAQRKYDNGIYVQSLEHVREIILLRMGFETQVMLKQEEKRGEESDEDQECVVSFSPDLKGYVAAVAKSFNKDISRLANQDKQSLFTAISTASLLSEVLHKFLENSNGDPDAEVKSLLAQTLIHQSSAYKKLGMLRDSQRATDQAIQLEKNNFNLTSLNTIKGKSIYQLNLCAIFSDLKDYNQAKQYAEAAIEKLLKAVEVLESEKNLVRVEKDEEEDETDGERERERRIKVIKELKEKNSLLAMAYYNLACQCDYMLLKGEALSNFQKAKHIEKVNNGSESILYLRLSSSLGKARMEFSNKRGSRMRSDLKMSHQNSMSGERSHEILSQKVKQSSTRPQSASVINRLNHRLMKPPRPDIRDNNNTQHSNDKEDRSHSNSEQNVLYSREAQLISKLRSNSRQAAGSPTRIRITPQRNRYQRNLRLADKEQRDLSRQRRSMKDNTSAMTSIASDNFRNHMYQSNGHIPSLKQNRVQQMFNLDGEPFQALFTERNEIENPILVSSPIMNNRSHRNRRRSDEKPILEVADSSAQKDTAFDSGSLIQATLTNMMTQAPLRQQPSDLTHRQLSHRGKQTSQKPRLQLLAAGKRTGSNVNAGSGNMENHDLVLSSDESIGEGLLYTGHKMQSLQQKRPQEIKGDVYLQEKLSKIQHRTLQEKDVIHIKKKKISVDRGTRSLYQQANDIIKGMKIMSPLGRTTLTANNFFMKEDEAFSTLNLTGRQKVQNELQSKKSKHPSVLRGASKSKQTDNFLFDGQLSPTMGLDDKKAKRKGSVRPKNKKRGVPKPMDRSDVTAAQKRYPTQMMSQMRASRQKIDDDQKKPIQPPNPHYNTGLGLQTSIGISSVVEPSFIKGMPGDQRPPLNSERSILSHSSKSTNNKTQLSSVNENRVKRICFQNKGQASESLYDAVPRTSERMLNVLARPIGYDDKPVQIAKKTKSMIVNGMLVTKDLGNPKIAHIAPRVKLRERQLSPSMQAIVDGLNKPKMKKGAGKPKLSLRAIAEQEQQQEEEQKRLKEERRVTKMQKVKEVRERKRIAAEEAKKPKADSIYPSEGTTVGQPTADDYTSRVTDCPKQVSIDAKQSEKFQEEEIESIEAAAAEVKSEVYFVEANVAPNAGICLWVRPYESLIHGSCKIEMILVPSEILQPGIILRAVYDSDKYRDEIFSAFFADITIVPPKLESSMLEDNLEKDLELLKVVLGDYARRFQREQRNCVTPSSRAGSSNKPRPKTNEVMLRENALVLKRAIANAFRKKAPEITDFQKMQLAKPMICNVTSESVDMWPEKDQSSNARIKAGSPKKQYAHAFQGASSRVPESRKKYTADNVSPTSQLMDDPFFSENQENKQHNNMTPGSVKDRSISEGVKFDLKSQDYVKFNQFINVSRSLRCLVRLQQSVHLFVQRNRQRMKKMQTRKVLFNTTIKKGISLFRVQVVHDNEQVDYVLKVSYTEAMRSTSNMQYLNWTVPVADRQEFDGDTCGYLRRLISRNLLQSRFNRSQLRLPIEGEYEEADDVPQDSYGLGKGQGSSDHTSYPFLSYQDTQFARSLANKANYHPKESPVVLEDDPRLKKSHSIMLIEDVYKTDFFEHELSEVPLSIEPPISERYPGSPKDKPIQERIPVSGFTTPSEATSIQSSNPEDFKPIIPDVDRSHLLPDDIHNPPSVNEVNYEELAVTDTKNAPSLFENIKTGKSTENQSHVSSQTASDVVTEVPWNFQKVLRFHRWNNQALIDLKPLKEAEVEVRLYHDNKLVETKVLDLDVVTGTALLQDQYTKTVRDFCKKFVLPCLDIQQADDALSLLVYEEMLNELKVQLFCKMKEQQKQSEESEMSSVSMPSAIQISDVSMSKKDKKALLNRMKTDKTVTAKSPRKLVEQTKPVTLPSSINFLSNVSFVSDPTHEKLGELSPISPLNTVLQQRIQRFNERNSENDTSLLLTPKVGQERELGQVKGSAEVILRLGKKIEGEFYIVTAMRLPGVDGKDQLVIDAVLQTDNQTVLEVRVPWVDQTLLEIQDNLDKLVVKKDSKEAPKSKQDVLMLASQRHKFKSDH